VIVVPEAAMLIREGWAELVNGQNIADRVDVKIRIVRQPPGTVFGVILSTYHVGQTYDVAPTLAQYLVLEGYAIFEMRSDSDRPDRKG
jgi:hypothetical protein